MKPGLIEKTKRLIVVLMLVLMNYSVIIAQTTYTHDPISYPSWVCNTSNFTACSFTFTGKLLKLKGTTGSQLSLTMAKCGSGSFGSTTDYYLK
jgi:hypothetical protein